MKIRPELDRFLEKVEPCPMTGCWIWTASTSRDGYGHFNPDSELRNERAHRTAWRLFKGEDIGNFKVLHHCDVRLCVNPNHLFLGTHQNNMDDMKARGRLNTSGLWIGHGKWKRLP